MNDTYRTEGDKLFTFNSDQNAYVFAYSKPGVFGKSLIKAYEEEVNDRAIYGDFGDGDDF